MTTVTLWITAHPVLTAWIAAALLSILAWATQLPRVQAVLLRWPLLGAVADIVAHRLLAMTSAIGLDVPKLLAALVRGQAPTVPQPAPPEKPSTIVNIVPPLGLLTLCLHLAGCPQPTSPSAARDRVRGALLVSVQAVEIADGACATASLPDLAASIRMHKVCADAKDRAIAAIVLARDTLKTWDDAAAGKLGCAALDIVHGLGDLVDAAKLAGKAPSVEVVDGIAGARFLASLAAGSCVAVDAGVSNG